MHWCVYIYSYLLFRISFRSWYSFFLYNSIPCLNLCKHLNTDMYSTWRWIHKRFACFLLKYSFHDYIRLLKLFCFILSMNCSENELKRSVALKTRIKSIGELIIDDIQGAHCFEVFLWYLRNGHWSVGRSRKYFEL